MNIWGIYIPQIVMEKNQVQGIINLGLTLVIMICVVIIIRDAIPAWISGIKKSRDKANSLVAAGIADPGENKKV